jgi:class 3 adenylate cyclase
LVPSVIRALVIALLFSLAGCGRVFVAPVTEPVAAWRYRWGDAPPAVTEAAAGPWQPLTLPDRPAGRGGRTNLWLRTQLPAVEARDPTLYVPAVDEIFEIYVGGEKIYTHGAFDAAGAGRFAGWPIHLVRLPAGFAGRTLYVRVHSKHFNIGVSGVPRIGGNADVVTFLMYRNISQLVIGTGFLLACVVTVFLLAGSRSQRKEFALFALFCLFIGAYLLARDELRSFLPVNQLALVYVEMATLWLGTASFVAFSAHVFGSSVGGFERWLWRGYLGMLLVLAAAIGAGWLTLSRALIVQNVLLVVTIPVVLYSILRKALAGDDAARVFVVGVAVLAVFAAADLAGGVGLSSYSYVTHWGFLGMLAAFGIVLSRRYVEATAQLARLNTAYERFVPREFLTLMAKRSITDVELGDHAQREMTILFCNIRAFTALSESMTPGENFRFLNSYLKRVSPIIREHGGFIDKYIGDGIMALFPHSPADAVHAAVEMLSAIEVYNTHRWKSGYAPIRVGIGIHCGPLILGTIGNPDHLQGTVISDAVNLAARLEGLTKTYGAPIVVSERVKQALAGVETVPLGMAEVKGKRAKVGVHAVVIARPALAALALALLCVTGCAGERRPHPVTPVAEWQYRWGDAPGWAPAPGGEAAWHPLRLPERPAEPGGRRNVWLRTQLPPLEAAEPTLYLPPVDTLYEVYLGEERIYANGVMGAGGRGPFAGWNPSLVHLPAGYAGRSLYLRIYSSHLNIGVSGVPRLGDAPDVQWFVLSRNLSQLLIGWVFVLTGLGAAVLTVGSRGLRGLRREYASFALFCVFLGIYLLARNELRAWVYANGVHAVYVEGASLWLGAASLVAFCEHVFGSTFGGFERKLWKAYVLALVPTALALGLGWAEVTSAIVVMSVLLGVSVPVVFASVVRKALAGNAEARVFTLGMLVFATFTGVDLLGGLGFISFAYVAQWGLLFLLVTLGYILSSRYLQLTRRLVRLNASYERFVPREFLTLMGKASIVDVALGDHSQREMTVLFCDIRSFTALSESITPAQNFRFLNSYLRRVSPVIREHGGFIDKYIGDCIMALFPNSPEDAVRAAVELFSALEAYNVERARAGYVPVRVGVGIHVGPVILGTIGNPEHMQGTVIADAVNLAARLEGLTKTFGAQIIVSDALTKSLGGADARMLGITRVKGKKRRVIIHEVFAGLSSEQVRARRETRVDFQAGVGAFFRKDFAVAAELFARVAGRNPADTAARLYLERSRRYAADGVPAGWDALESGDEAAAPA